MRAAFLLLSLLLLATFAWPSMQTERPLPAAARVDYRPVPLVEVRPNETRLGGLTFLGAWQLTSNDWRFGGISALHVDGEQALAFGDAGWLMRFPLPRGQARSPLRIEALPAGPGDPREKSDRDVEAAAVDGEGAWLAFERANAVWRYDTSLSRAEASSAPASMRRWTDNHGPEAMVRLPGGRFLVFAEGEEETSELLLFGGDPAAAGTPVRTLRYRPPVGYRITDAALLPDGRLLLLNRRFSLLGGFTAKLTVAPLSARGGELSGTEIAAFDGETERDNLEGLSIVREGGRTILWIASDDNYNALQRTLLMKFALAER